MLWLGYLGLLITTLASASSLTTRQSLKKIAERYTRRTAGGVHLPIVRTEASEMRRRGLTAAIGLGDFRDASYSVLISIGGATAPLILDTGSSDLWIISDKYCSEGCLSSQVAYPQASFQYSGVDAELLYGDSRTRTFASGMIGKDTVSLASLSLSDQYFVAINRTNNTLDGESSSGIVGLGFPVLSKVWRQVWNQSRASNTTVRREVVAEPPARKQRRQAGSGVSSVTTPLLASWSVFGPFLSRFVTASQLTLPMFSTTLQRDVIQIGGNVGELSIGELPSGVSNDSLTWVPVRLYPFSQSGLPAPTDSPNEVYPLEWEVPLDDVYLDGVKLPRSNLSSSSISLSALIDSGNSILRGPADVVQQIQTKLGANGRFACSEPHTIAFSIGGKLFPVDPRDFISTVSISVGTCEALIEATDPPSTNGTQFSWSLGDPFLKSVLAAFYYGNLTYPSHDPPRMGFLSTVPMDAVSQLTSAAAAVKPGGHAFPTSYQTAPSGTFKAAGTASNGVLQATTVSTSSSSKALQTCWGSAWIFLATTSLLLL